MTISSLLTQQQNFGLSHFVLLQKIMHLIEHVEHIFVLIFSESSFGYRR